VFQNPELFGTQVSLSPEQSKLVPTIVIEAQLAKKHGKNNFF
jgi:hypothetical protein